MTTIAVPFHLDEHLPDLDLPLTAVTLLEPRLPAGTTWERMAVLHEAVATAVAEDAAAGRVPVVLSGDCTTSLGIVAGLQRAGVDPALVWFDAHGDVQTPETSTSGYLGGMPVRQLVGAADRTVPDRLGLRALAEHDVVLVDARDLDPPEAEYLAGAAIIRCGIDRIITPAGPVYLHVDVDVIDPRDVPGLLFPTPDGPRLPTVRAAIRTVLDSCSVAAVGIACTWRPGAGADHAVAALVAEIAAAATPEQHP